MTGLEFFPTTIIFFLSISYPAKTRVKYFIPFLLPRFANYATSRNLTLYFLLHLRKDAQRQHYLQERFLAEEISILSTALKAKFVLIEHSSKVLLFCFLFIPLYKRIAFLQRGNYNLKSLSYFGGSLSCYKEYFLFQNKKGN